MPLLFLKVWDFLFKYFIKYWVFIFIFLRISQLMNFQLWTRPYPEQKPCTEETGESLLLFATHVEKSYIKYSSFEMRHYRDKMVHSSFWYVEMFTMGHNCDIHTYIRDKGHVWLPAKDILDFEIRRQRISSNLFPRIKEILIIQRWFENGNKNLKVKGCWRSPR